MGTAAERPGLLAFLTGLQGKKCPSPRESPYLHCSWVKLAEAWNPGEGLRRSFPLAADPRSEVTWLWAGVEGPLGARRMPRR